MVLCAFQSPRSFGFLAALCLAGLLTACAARSADSPSPEPAPSPTQSGGDLFQSYCAACHQYDGQGVGEAPPLKDSPWVTGAPDRLIKIVLHGVRGAMVIEGKTYNREMPGFGQILSDTDAASLLTFVRESFGTPSEPISADAVHRIRTTNQDRNDYWTVDELSRDQN